MAARIALLFLAAVVLFQVLMWESHATVIRRDVAGQSGSASQTVDEAIQSFKTGLDDLVKNIQSNELLQNVSQSLKNFGEQVQKQSQDLVAKIQNATKSN